MWQRLIPVMKQIQNQFWQSWQTNGNIKTTFHLHWYHRNKSITLPLPSTSCFIPLNKISCFGIIVHKNLKNIYWNHQPIIKEIMNLHANEDYLLFLHLYNVHKKFALLTGKTTGISANKIIYFTLNILSWSLLIYTVSIFAYFSKCAIRVSSDASSGNPFCNKNKFHIKHTKDYMQTI